MKKILISAAVLVLIVLVLFNVLKKNDDSVIKMGAVYSLTGPLSSYGIEFKNGLTLAMEEINNSGGILGKKVEFIFEDDNGDVNASVSSTHKLINVDKVDYLFTAFSSLSEATMPIAKKAGVFYLSATVTKIGNGESTFRDYWDIGIQGKAIGDVVKSKGYKSLGVIALHWAEDYKEYKEGLLSVIGENVKIYEERYNLGENDFRTQLLKIKSNKPDAIIVYGLPGAEVIKISNQIDELNIKVPVLAGQALFATPSITDATLKFLENHSVIDSWYSLDEKKGKEFVEKYEKRFGLKFIGDAGYTYDDLYALKYAIEKAGTYTDISKVSNELRLVDFIGVNGRLSFDNLGNSIRSAYLEQFKNGSWHKYENK